MAATVWTPIRKLMGNIVPALFWSPLAVYGVYAMFARHQVLGTGVWCLIGATVLGWLGVNSFGLFQNSVMRRQLARILNAEEDLPKDRVFVGFTTPQYTGLLDAHEDVGFLCFTPESLLLVGERRTIEMKKESVKRISFKPNSHTILGLGRWISIEAPKRMLIEPRDRPTMLGNMMESSRLRKKIERWEEA